MKLVANPRTVLGKKVKALRKAGILPAHLYGHDVEPRALEIPASALRELLDSAGHNEVVTLDVEDGKRAAKPANVMVREVQRHPITGEILHVDLFQVRLNERIDVEVPIELVGIAPAVDQKLGTLIQEATTLHVSALPRNIPSMLQVDVSELSEPHQAIRAADLELPGSVSLLSSPEQVLVTITPIHRREEPELAAPPAAEEEAERLAGAEPEAEEKDDSKESDDATEASVAKER